MFNVVFFGLLFSSMSLNCTGAGSITFNILRHTSFTHFKQRLINLYGPALEHQLLFVINGAI